jgi:predicted  nucleic acid-binding Zn-ribbon protein
MLALREPTTEKEMKRRRHALIKLEEKSHLPTTDMKEAILRLRRLDKPSKGVVRMERKIKSLEKEISAIEHRMEKLEESLASALMEEYLHLEEDIDVDDDSGDNDDDESSDEEEEQEEEEEEMKELEKAPGGGVEVVKEMMLLLLHL